MTLDDKLIFVFIREKLLEYPFADVIRNQLKNSNPILSHSDKIKFHDGLLYHNGLLYLLDGLAQLQVLQIVRHNVLVTSHFGFSKTMELMSCDY
jgi:hypothetical protein